MQFVGSLIAIVALAALARWLRLGPTPKISSEGEAREAAEQAVVGFDPQAIGIDSQGRGAIMRDAGGRLLLVRPHGSHLAARLLSPDASIAVEDGELLVDCGERRFGITKLTLEDSQAWVEAMKALKESHDA